jgi:hypothetical protein
VVRGAEDCQHLVHIWSQLLGLKVRHHFLEDFGSTLLDCPQDAEQHPARDPAPGAIASPCRAFEGFSAFALTLPQGPRAQTRALGGAPPAGAGQGKAPEERFVFIQHYALAPARPVREGRKGDRARGEGGGGGARRPGGREELTGFFLQHCAHAHDRLGRWSVGPAPWPVRGHAMASRWSHAGGGLHRPDA